MDLFNICEGEDQFKAFQLFGKLSDYNIYSGKQSDLHPANSYKICEAASPPCTVGLVTQKLIKLPARTAVTARFDSLPNDTILVKTFYVYLDTNDAPGVKNILESRLLIKYNRKWQFGLYRWTEDQKDAFLMTAPDNVSLSLMLPHNH